ncbi:hypothetical protein B4U80_13681 [Leptotrombidium deliense]|uniref:Ionotropic glutamate receptor L-glutamate and glycine-binding domain-containing protein n=1 Tax=Leptotrombidium deliense TaxID=299467 RepID=A0A443SLL8_9ACAR|nr:hypothetical protein B4U80_13681 [Leptotrombidium deliense]
MTQVLSRKLRISIETNMDGNSSEIWLSKLNRARQKLLAFNVFEEQKLYKIVTVIVGRRPNLKYRPPFMMKHSNGSFYGYLVDLLHHIQEKLNNRWHYEIREAADGFIGKKIVNTSRWDGVIGELQMKVRS